MSNYSASRLSALASLAGAKKWKQTGVVVCCHWRSGLVKKKKDNNNNIEQRLSKKKKKMTLLYSQAEFTVNGSSEILFLFKWNTSDMGHDSVNRKKKKLPLVTRWLFVNASPVSTQIFGIYPINAA